MKGGVTKRIEDTVKALEQGQLKKALYLSEGNEKLSRQHQFVEEAARTCIANKGDKEACSMAVKEARDKVQDTISLPIDDTSLEGLEDCLTEQKQPVESPAQEADQEAPKSEQEKTDEELYEECEECHVAVAAARFAEVCTENPEEAGRSCEIISQKLEDENTEPADWIKAMVQTAEAATGQAQADMVGAVTELTDYLERRKSPFLKKLEEGEGGEEDNA
ncbi:hypothetical protein ES703_104830 [subsurface metagenome]